MYLYNGCRLRPRQMPELCRHDYNEARLGIFFAEFLLKLYQQQMTVYMTKI